MERHRPLFKLFGLHWCPQPCSKLFVATSAARTHANHKCAALAEQRAIEDKHAATATGAAKRVEDSAKIVDYSLDDCEDDDDDEKGRRPTPLTAPSLVDPFPHLPSHFNPKLISVLTRLHQGSRGLCKLLPGAQWREPEIEAWKRATADITPDLRAALDANDHDENSSELLNIVLRVAELPLRVLLPHLPKPKTGGGDLNHPDAPGTEAGGDRRLRKVEALANLDLDGKAFQQLNSNGVRSDKVAGDTITAMHPKLGKPLETAELYECKMSTPQATVTIAQAKKFLFQAASTDRSAIGFFGWGASMLFHLRGMKGERTFFHQFARLITTIANAQLHDVFGFVLSCGSLFALNKLTEPEQEARIAQGLDPKLRPVNVGTAFLKWAFKLALRTDAALEAIAAMSPIQMGLKAKHGVAAVVHLFRALREKGWSISLSDFENGFNQFYRQKMLEAVKKRCPQLMGLFLKFYALKSMCLMRVDGEEGFRVIWSEEGSRMGCCFGSLGFDLTVQDLYEHIAKLYPDACLKALTDDLVIAFPPLAMDEADAKGGDSVVPDGGLRPVVDAKRVQECYDEIESKGAELGLKLVRSKSAIIPPKGATVAPDSFPDIELKWDGARVAGGFVGTDMGCERYLDDLVTDLETKFVDIKSLRDACPQVAFKLLRGCLNHALTFFLQVTPPLLSLKAAARFDRLKLEAAEAIITPTCMPTPPLCSETRRARAEHLLSMPASLRGAGLTSAVTIAPGAWYSSVAAAKFHDPDLARHADGLARFGRHCHHAIMERIGDVPSAASKGIEAYFDRDCEDSLVLTNFYRDTFINKPNVKLQKRFTQAAHALANDKHLTTLARCAPSTLSTLVNDKDIVDSDVVAGFTKSMKSCVFYAQLKYPRNRMGPYRFSTWVRFFLKLPQPPHLQAGNLRPRTAQLSYDAEECLGHHAKGIDKLLDLHANHACSRCVSSFAGMGERHSNLKWCIHAFAKEADLRSSVEPKTHDILNRGSYEYTPEMVRCLFPKGSTKKQRQYADELLGLHAKAATLREGLKERQLLEKRCKVLKALILQSKGEKGNLRIDNELRDVHTGEERWVDVTSVHPTAKSHIKAELKTQRSFQAFVRALRVSEREVVEEEDEKYRGGDMDEVKGEEKKKHRKTNKKKEEKKEEKEERKGEERGKLEQEVGHTVTKQEKMKVDTYSPLVRIAELQHQNGKRMARPVFHPFVVTTLGEVGPKAVALREWIIGAYARKLEREGPRDDGRAIKAMTADFRSRFRSAIQIAVAKGLARMISSAGFPTTSCAKHTG
jgi:hypothetical protein